MSQPCAICGRPIVDQALTCTVCTNVAISHLAGIVRLLPDARLVAAGLVRHGTAGGGGKPASRPPLNIDATDALHAIGNALTTIGRDIAETRGIQFASAALGGRRVSDPLVEAAEWLSDQMRWLRGALDEQGQPYAVHVFAEIARCDRRIRGVVDGPAGRKYLGPCGYVETPEECTRYGIGDHDCAQHQPCDGNVYVRVDATTGRCQTCGAGAARSEREAWLDSEVRGWAYRASEIEEAYGVDANLIRQWATPARSLVQVHGHDREGRALYLLSQVLDVARSQAVKREERRAARERRTAARAAGSERVA